MSIGHCVLGNPYSGDLHKVRVVYIICYVTVIDFLVRDMMSHTQNEAQCKAHTKSHGLAGYRELGIN